MLVSVQRVLPHYGFSSPKPHAQPDLIMLVPHDDRAVAERLAQIARHPALSSSSVAKGTPLAGDRILCSGSYRRGDVSEDGRTSASSSRTHSASSSLTKN